MAKKRSAQKNNNKNQQDGEKAANGESNNPALIPPPVFWDRMVVLIMAFIVVMVTLALVWRNERFQDENLVVLTRILISVSMGVIGASVPGVFESNIEFRGWQIRAAGATCFFVVTFFGTPKVVPLKLGNVTPSPIPIDAFDGIPVADITPPVPARHVAFNYEPPDTLNYAGFTIISDERFLDLRRLNDVPSSKLTTRHSPACFARHVRLKRNDESATRFVVRYATSGSGIDARCTTPGVKWRVGYAGLRSNTKEPLLMKNFDLIMDVTEKPIGEEFDLEMTATHWNGFTEAEEWTGFDARETEELDLKILKVMFPRNKPFTNLWYRFTVEPKDDEVPMPTYFIEHRDKGNRGVSWKLEQPDPKLWIETKWTW